MIYKVYMPKYGANIETGKILEWKKHEGDSIEKGEIIAVVETSKAVFELEAEDSGILKKILVSEFEEIPANQVIAIISDAEDDISTTLIEIEKHTIDRSAEFVKTMDASVFDGVSEGKTKSVVRITPAARRLIREHMIDDEVVAAIRKEVVEETDILSILQEKKVFIYGASTGAKQIIEILRSVGGFNILGIIDDNKEYLQKQVQGLEVLGDFAWLKKKFEEIPDFDVMISSHSTNRKKIFRRIVERLPELNLPPIIDTRAILLSGVSVGDSSLIEAGVILGHEVSIGKNVILNLGAKISHNSVIGDHSHIAIGTSISAAVFIEENVFIGAGVAINPAVTIGKNAVISPNSSVLNDIPENVLVNGVPGKIVGESKRGKH